MILLFSLLNFCLFLSNICAEDMPFIRIEMPSSPNIVGSGARALGMGGAFIGFANDATAASSNPGGLHQLETKEVSIVGDYSERFEDNSIALSPGASGKESVFNHKLNYLSAAYPFRFGYTDMIISINYQQLYDFDRHWSYQMDYHDPFFTKPVHMNYKQDGDLYAIGLAYCTMVHPDVYLGFTLNYWGDFIHKNTWKQHYRESGNVIMPPPPAPDGIEGYYIAHKTEEYSFKGWNVNFGFWWLVNQNLRLGGVIKTPFSADIHHKTSWMYQIHYPSAPESNITKQSKTSSNETLHMPLSYGLGLAYNASDTLRFAFDIYRTNWDDFELEQTGGIRTSPISGQNSSNMNPTTWLRSGVEYRIEKKNTYKSYTSYSLRSGLFYDPAPGEGKTDKVYGFSLGFGIAHKAIVFDMAYQYRTGNNVGRSALPSFGFSQDITEHKLYSSLIIHFSDNN